MFIKIADIMTFLFMRLFHGIRRASGRHVTIMNVPSSLLKLFVQSNRRLIKLRQHRPQLGGSCGIGWDGTNVPIDILSAGPLFPAQQKH